MFRSRASLTWLISFGTAAAFVIGASADQASFGQSQGVVSPADPIFGLQDPGPQEPDSQEEATPARGGRAGGGGRGQQQAPRPYAEVLKGARTDDGIFKVHRVGEDVFYEIPKAELGRDFEPGAFGVHNTSRVLGGELRHVGGREVVVVKSEVRNTDFNLAGLEECIDNTDRETVCALGHGTTPTRCIGVPVSSESGCGLGVEPEDMDEEAKQLVAERKAEWKHTSQKLSWTVAPDGKLVIRTNAGAIAGTHRLF